MCALFLPLIILLPSIIFIKMKRKSSTSYYITPLTYDLFEVSDNLLVSFPYFMRYSTRHQLIKSYLG